MAATGDEFVKLQQFKTAMDSKQPDISDVPRLDSGKMKSLHQLGITDLNNVTEPGTYVGASGFGGYPTMANLPDEFMMISSGAIPVFYIDVYRFDTPDDMEMSANRLIQKLYPMYESGIERAYIRRGSIASGAQWGDWFGIGVPQVAGNSEVGYVLQVKDNYGNIEWGQMPEPDMTGVVKASGDIVKILTADGAGLSAIGVGELDSNITAIGTTGIDIQSAGSGAISINASGGFVSLGVTKGGPSINLIPGSGASAGLTMGSKSVASITDAIADSPDGEALVTDKAVKDYVKSLVATDEEFDSVFGL